MLINKKLDDLVYRIDDDSIMEINQDKAISAYLTTYYSNRIACKTVDPDLLLDLSDTKKIIELLYKIKSKCKGFTVCVESCPFYINRKEFCQLETLTNSLADCLSGIPEEWNLNELERVLDELDEIN